MPVTLTEIPVLSQFVRVVKDTTGSDMAGEQNEASSRAANTDDSKPKTLPKGVVLGKDGKPCRTCTSVAAWRQMTQPQVSAPSNAAMADAAPPPTLPADCPPDVDRLGNHTWTLLHTLTATYPTKPTGADQRNALQFIDALSRVYPCSACADDFRDWMGEKGNEPRLRSREEFGRWMCRAHNVVNIKLGKRSFDCGKWWERWGEGPSDKCG